MIEADKRRGSNEQRKIPVRYAKLRTEAETTLLLLTAVGLDDVTVEVSKTPGQPYRDAPIDADPEVIESFPERIVPPGFNYVTLVFPQNPEVFNSFWERYMGLRQEFAGNQNLATAHEIIEE